MRRGLPAVEDLFTSCATPSSRFATLRMRIADTSRTARGEEVTNLEVSLRHPGHAKVTTSQAGREVGGDYDIWISDGDLVRTYTGAHKLGTQRPVRNRPRGLDDRDFPGTAQVYEPVTLLPAETLPDTFVHPGGLLPERPRRPGAARSPARTVAIGREAIMLVCDHPRTTELPATDRTTGSTSTVDRATGVILRLVETIGDDVSRDAEVLVLDPDAPLPPSAFEFTFPSGTTMLY